MVDGNRHEHRIVQLDVRSAVVVLTAIAAMSACGGSGAGSANDMIEPPTSVSPAPPATTPNQVESSQSGSTPAATVEADVTAPSLSAVTAPIAASEGPALPGVMPPDLGQFTDEATLIDALIASGPLDNQLLTDSALRPGVSICADIAHFHEPTVGTLVHEAGAMLNGQGGVLLVFLRTDGSSEVRMYGTGDADPVTGGCPLLLQAVL